MKDILDKFWEQVTLDISKKYNRLKRPISKWKRRDIELFLGDFLFDIEKQCEKDSRKQNLCGIPVNLSYDTFKRILQDKTSKGQKATQHMFAIYLGYISYQDYIAQNELEEGVDIRNNQNASNIIEEIDKTVFSKKIIGKLMKSNNNFKQILDYLEPFTIQHLPHYKIPLFNINAELEDLELAITSKKITKEVQQVTYNDLRNRIDKIVKQLIPLVENL